MHIETMAQRHSYILNRLQHDQNIRVADLCAELNVSAVTIRKDLKLLSDKKLLYRSHGSISLQNPYATDRDVTEKGSILTDQKTRIGKQAATLLEPGEAVIIASGSTVLQLALAIPQDMPLTVLTSAMNISMALIDKPNIEIVQLGGIVRKSSMSAIGPYAEDLLAHFSCTKLFMGVDGLDIDQGCTTTNMLEAQLNKAMIHTAQEVIVLADSSKFGKRSFGKICPLADLHHIITDTGVNKNTLELLENLGIEVTCV
ncbi:DeoR family transcriptional regulator of aga operon [Dyadobacter jejuensis]|uniref:DeoR family transcriptional regulator of aga operon n=1 Tax=Dyadobacter jejuensis TaxID=1082580 RepID=A0A316AJT8_9BACT|nr:DeoR/GlpR family DNA-binding transcription regulator [Dyadobacter jejuensis]PWJ57244.1 DeoR family transcriptional regulator of aga operon [Dyadobacter jejuensis]